MDPVSNACDELFETISQSADSRLLVAFSGGMDSVVLLHAIAERARTAGLLDRVLAIHVDHGLDPASSEWAEQCRSQAASLAVGIEVHRLEIAPGSNLEARARHGRYQLFESLLQPADLLVLAHHAGDQLESRLLHLFQGRGLYGMPAARTLGPGRLLRPLLDLPREALAAYARLHDLRWIEDPSNADESLDRNFLRRSLLPMLNARFPALPKRIDQVGTSLQDMQAAIDELGGLERQPLPMSVFDGLSRTARLALLRRWLSRHAQAGGLSRAALEEFLRQLDSGNDRQPALALPGGRLVRYRRALHLAPDAVVLEPSYKIEVPGVLRLPHGELSITAGHQGDSPDPNVALVPPVVVRFATDGLRIRRGGHERAVRELMRESGIPPWQRASLPVLTDQRGVALIPGVAVRDADPQTSGEMAGLYTVRWQGTPDAVTGEGMTGEGMTGEGI